MSIKREKQIAVPHKYTVSARAEIYNTTKELVYDNRHREVRHRAYDMSARTIKPNFHGVSSCDEAYTLLATGYQPVVSTLKEEVKVGTITAKRIALVNDIQGFAPVVPLALTGIPNCMIDTRVKPMKSKVIDIYYDMTANYGNAQSAFIKAGKLLLSAVLGLEKQGYRLNIYAMQSYWDSRNYSDHALDILCVKIKSSDCPLDIKRMSFPLAHPAFFRVVGFEWQSKSPITRFIGDGRGGELIGSFDAKARTEIIKAIFGNNAFYIPCAALIEGDYSTKTLQEALINGKVE